ncbi:MAG: hypothetical protein R2850_02655 [Bacteroidia bacterium]
MRNIRLFNLIIYAFALLAIGGSAYFSVYRNAVNRPKIPAGSSNFPGCNFELIPSHFSGNNQAAFVYLSQSITPKPLVVSLHTWGGSFQQEDSVLFLAKQKDWNYIHPDFGGPMWNEGSCCLPEAIQLIEEAVHFMLKKQQVDNQKLIFIGKSGGASAVLSLYQKGVFPEAYFYAWSPITDFIAWREEVSKDSLLKSKYLAKINLGSGTGSEDRFDSIQAAKKSPYFQEFIHTNSELFIYTGLFDGTAGWSTSIDQPVKFFNKITEALNESDSTHIIKQDELELWHMAQKGEYSFPVTGKQVGSRRLLEHKHFNQVHFILFDGGHEIIYPEVINQFNRAFPNE